MIHSTAAQAVYMHMNNEDTVKMIQNTGRMQCVLGVPPMYGVSFPGGPPLPAPVPNRTLKQNETPSGISLTINVVMIGLCGS